MEKVVKGRSILRTEGQLTSFGWPKWVIQVTWKLWRQEMLPGNRTVLAVEDIMFLKKLCGRRRKMPGEVQGDVVRDWSDKKCCVLVAEPKEWEAFGEGEENVIVSASSLWGSGMYLSDMVICLVFFFS